MAYQRLENQAKSDEIAHEIEKMRGPEGGIVYACPPVEDFSDWESVAGHNENLSALLENYGLF